MAVGRPVKKTRDSAGVIEPGYWVFTLLVPGVAPWTAVIGQVQAVNEQGIRITLMDEQTREAEGWDFVFQWPDVRSILIATPDHEIDVFKNYALDMYTRHNVAYSVDDSDTEIDEDNEHNDNVPN